MPPRSTPAGHAHYAHTSLSLLLGGLLLAVLALGGLSGCRELPQDPDYERPDRRFPLELKPARVLEMPPSDYGTVCAELGLDDASREKYLYRCRSRELEGLTYYSGARALEPGSDWTLLTVSRRSDGGPLDWEVARALDGSLGVLEVAQAFQRKYGSSGLESCNPRAAVGDSPFTFRCRGDVLETREDDRVMACALRYSIFQGGRHLTASVRVNRHRTGVGVSIKYADWTPNASIERML